MGKKLVVMCTCASLEEAEKIAHALVGRRLAACVNLINGVRSIYRWQGNVEESAEVLLVIKTREEVYDELEQEIRRLHSYTAPEVIALPVDRGAAAYLQWIGAETS